MFLPQDAKPEGEGNEYIKLKVVGQVSMGVCPSVVCMPLEWGGVWCEWEAGQAEQGSLGRQTSMARVEGGRRGLRPHKYCTGR